MTDIVLVATLVVFFALSVLFVRACERIIGPDVEGDAVDESPESRAAA
jgi:hypothetical protein